MAIGAERVKELLEETGFPLELQVAREFRRARGPYGVAASVVHSSFYRDPQTDKPREIDVIATFGSAITKETPTRYEVVFVVECKSGASGGWALFTGASEPWVLGLLNRVHHPDHLPWVTIIGASGTEGWGRAGIELSPIVASSGKPVGFKEKEQTTNADTQKKRPRNPDTVYEAITGVVGAANAHSAVDTRYARIVFPVVVTDVPLFACSMEEETTEISVDEIEGGQVPLLWRRPVGDREGTIVDIVAVDALADYVDNATAMAMTLLEKTRGDERLIARLTADARKARAPGKYL